MTSPTKTAEDAFRFAKHQLQLAKASEYAELNHHLKGAIMEISYGLEHLSVGLRATYMLLEEVQREVRQLKQARPS